MYYAVHCTVHFIRYTDFDDVKIKSLYSKKGYFHIENCCFFHYAVNFGLVSPVSLIRDFLSDEQDQMYLRYCEELILLLQSVDGLPTKTNSLKPVNSTTVHL